MTLMHHCGPIQPPGRTVLVHPNGIETLVDCIQPPSSPAAWQAQWIWLNPADYPSYQTSRYTVFCEQAGHSYAVALFRKKIKLDEAPLRVNAWVSADTKYRLYVNGVLAGRGPAEVGGDYNNQQPPDWWFYDAYDLTPLMHAGENILLAEVVLGAVVQADYSMGHGGFLFQAEIQSVDDVPIIIISDATWQGALNLAATAPYRFDARLAASDPHAFDFDASAWPVAQVIAAATQGHWKLLPRGIPSLAEARLFPTDVIIPFKEFQKRVNNPEALIQPEKGYTTVSPGSPLTLWLQFDRELTGHPQLCVAGAAGTILELGLQEIPGKDDRMQTYILRDGLQWYEGFELHGFQYMRLMITFPGGGNCSTSLQIHTMAANFTSFPLSYRGQFSCSDELFNALWQTGRWTTQLCMQAYHLDSPIHQEALGCTGDYRIEALISQYAFGETRLARQDLLRTAWLLQQKEGRMFHTSYSLLWIEMLAEYWQHTADLEAVTQMLPALRAVLALFHSYIGQSGLVTEAPNYMFMDWGHVDGYELHHPPCVIGQGYLSAFYVRALRQSARLFEICGDPAASRNCLGRAEAVAAAFHRELWVAERGLYCDGRPFRSKVPPNNWLPADGEQIYFSQYINALAVACGIVSPEEAPALLRRALQHDSSPSVQPYFMHYIFDALGKAGLFGELGIPAMRKWQALLDEHPSSLKEGWDFGDYSHAWGGSPVYQFFTQILGVTPIEPGFRQVRIQPQLGDLAWAEGTIPTPQGPIRCRWERHGKNLTGQLSIPPTVTALLSIPHPETGGVLLLNGTVIREDQPMAKAWKIQHQCSFIEMVLPGGDYELDWKSS